jgi:hypothetical protein
MYKFVCFFFILISFSLSISAQPPKTKVLLLGTFHFDNPGLDVAKFENANVLTDKRQKEIAEVVKHLKAFKPDQIFIESSPSSQSYYDSILKAYKAGNYKLTANEIDQLGLRLAKELNLSFLHAVDYREASFPFDSLVKIMTAANQFGLLGLMKTTIDSIENNHNNQLRTSTIREMLVSTNTLADNNFSVGMYFTFLKAGGKDNHVGSYLASEWWRRNMIIYENILKRLNGNEKSILVIFGSSHTALLREFMKYNSQFELVDVASVLTDK